MQRCLRRLLLAQLVPETLAMPGDSEGIRWIQHRYMKSIRVLYTAHRDVSVAFDFASPTLCTRHGWAQAFLGGLGLSSRHHSLGLPKEIQAPFTDCWICR